MTTSPDQTPDASNPDDAPFQFSHRIRVRWAEADIQGVVFNGHYLTYFDIGITEFLRAVFGGSQSALHDTFDDLYVVKSTIDYHAPARFDEEIDIAVRTTRIGSSSLTFDFAVLREGEQLVSGQNIYVHAPGGESSPVPPSLRSALLTFDGSIPK